MVQRELTVLLALAAVIAVSGCAPKMVETAEFGDPQTSHRILIATGQSEFKQAVASEVIRGCEGAALFFKITDLRRLEFEAVESYTAIVIMNTCFAWQMDPRVKRFLESTTAKAKVIVMTTAGDSNWRSETAGVDAFTAASSPADVTRAAEKIRAGVREIIDAAV